MPCSDIRVRDLSRSWVCASSIEHRGSKATPRHATMHYCTVLYPRISSSLEEISHRICAQRGCSLQGFWSDFGFRISGFYAPCSTPRSVLHTALSRRPFTTFHLSHVGFRWRGLLRIALPCLGIARLGLPSSWLRLSLGFRWARLRLRGASRGLASFG